MTARTKVLPEKSQSTLTVWTDPAWVEAISKVPATKTLWW